MPVQHHRFSQWLRGLIDYLTTYTISDHGLLYTTTDDPTSGKTFIPALVNVLANLQPENRPFYLRSFLPVRVLELDTSLIEREDIREEEWQVI